jgi:CDP-diacylglycerol--serine O-phosphatidyltransferase
VVLMPNGLTLANLMCGIYAIVLATRGEFGLAPFFIVLGGVADTLDGRVARATGTGSRFGEELDSLVDAISFGFAPALLMFLAVPKAGNWEWLLVFFFTSCAVMRLARFNVEQAGRSKTHFHGLPSPAAGLTLATYYWFRETPLYNQTVILFTDSHTLADLPWHVLLRGLMALLAALMISDVPYPAVPSIGFGSLKKILGTIVVAGSLVMLAVGAKEFIFPAMLAYVLFGAIKWAIIGFIGRSNTPDEIFWGEDVEGQLAESEREDRRPGGTRPAAASTASSEPRRDRTVGEPRPASSLREPREHREGRPPREARVPRDTRETREPRETRETREPREIREPRESREAREAREPREARELPENGEIKSDDAVRRKRRRRGSRRDRPGGGSESSGSTPPGPILPDTPTESTE